MKHSCHRILTVAIIVFIILPFGVRAQKDNELVRLAIIEVDSNRLQSYNSFLKEEIESSILLEPGVQTLYGVAEKDSPGRIVLFETYTDSSEYRSHLATRHFQKYKQGTLDMVQRLKLTAMTSILYHKKKSLSKASIDQLFIQVARMEIKPEDSDKFFSLANNVMAPGLKKESGVLVMYIVAEKDNPGRIWVLEVYRDRKVYEMHLEARHVINFNNASLPFIQSIQIKHMLPILLGSK